MGLPAGPCNWAPFLVCVEKHVCWGPAFCTPSVSPAPVALRAVADGLWCSHIRNGPQSPRRPSRCRSGHRSPGLPQGFPRLLRTRGGSVRVPHSGGEGVLKHRWEQPVFAHNASVGPPCVWVEFRGPHPPSLPLSPPLSPVRAL